MWIAKPLAALAADERQSWMDAQPPGHPLSQTLAWGEAITAIGPRAYLVFSPDEGVGGIVHSPNGADFECVNGPLLDWDEPSAAPRQFATFAMAVSRLSPEFASLRLRPRWSSAELAPRLARLPIEPEGLSRASTLVIGVRGSEEQRLAALSPRLRRTLTVSRRAGSSCRVERPERARILEFARELKSFGARRGFFVPDERWLERLVFGGGAAREALGFWFVEARCERAEAATRLLVCVHGETAHYLFGVDQRSEAAPAAISTAAIAHYGVLSECAAKGIATYDLNGFSDPARDGDPYAGVSRFKAQFRGEVLELVSPIFRISNR